MPGGPGGPTKLANNSSKMLHFFLTDNYLPIGPCGPLTVFPIGPYKNTVIQQGSFFFVTQVAKCNKGLSYPFSFFSFLSFRTCVHTVTWRVILSPKRKELILRLALTGIINLQNLCGEKT